MESCFLKKISGRKRVYLGGSTLTPMMEMDKYENEQGRISRRARLGPPRTVSEKDHPIEQITA